MNLTEHFTLEELTHTDHREFDNTPNADQINNLQRVAELLEQVKKVLGGKPELEEFNQEFKALSTSERHELAALLSSTKPKGFAGFCHIHYAIGVKEK